MTATAWVSLLGIGVGAIVALTVAFLQRKQMRQIELHRIDPTVPLKPPPHPVTCFLKTYWYAWFYLGLAIFSLVRFARDLLPTTLVTRDVVFNIAFDVVLFFVATLLGLASLLSSWAIRIALKMGRLIDETSERVDQLEKREK